MNIEEALKILEIPLDSKSDDSIISKNFRRKALKTHSDHGGSDEEFMRVYQAYEFLKNRSKSLSEIIEDIIMKNIKKVFNEERKEKPIKVRDVELSEEPAEQVREAIFSRYVSEEANYFIENVGELAREYFDALKKCKETLFKRGWKDNRFRLANSPLDLLNGSLFFDLGVRSRLAKRVFDEISSQKELNSQLLERYITLFNPSEDLVTSVPLNGNVRGLELLLLITPPEKSREKMDGNEVAREKIFGDYWTVGDVQIDIRFGEYWEHSDGIYSLKSNPVGTGMTAGQASRLIKEIRDGIKSSDFELEVSREIPEGHPNYDFFTGRGKNHRRGGGFYIKKLRVGKTTVIVDGKYHLK